jgi:hypothetical protein
MPWLRKPGRNDIVGVGVRAFSTSFDTVFLVDDMPYKLLYPAEKFGPTGFFTVGMQDLGPIPDHEWPSQGWKWLKRAYAMPNV